jgi:hypothetical protein
MYSKSPAQLVSLVRFYTDTAGAAVRFPDADIKLMLDIGMACYWSQLAKSMCLADVQSQTVSITTATTYTVNSHSKLIAVELLVGDRYVPIRRANLFTVENDKQSGVMYYSEHISAVAAAATQHIVLHRKSNTSGGSFRIRYLKPAPNVTAGDLGAGWGFINGWEEVPVLEAAIRLLAKDKESDAHLRVLLDKAYERMANEASESDMFQRPTAVGTIKEEQWAGYRDGQI